MATKARAPLVIGATALESRDQRQGFYAALAAFVGSTDARRSGIARMQAERLKPIHRALFEQHRKEADEFRKISDRNGAPPTDWKTIDRYTALRDRYGNYAPDHVRAEYGVPSASDVHVSALLTDVLIDEPQGEFIADLVSPLFPVNKRVNQIPKMDRSAFLNANANVDRAAGEPAKMGSFAYASTTSYAVVNRAFGFAVPDETTQNQDVPYDVPRDTMRAAEEIVRLKREIALKDLLTTAANYPAAHRLSNTLKWDNADPTNVEPRNDVQTLKNLIRLATGRLPNCIILNFPMLQALTRLDDYRTRWQYVSAIDDRTLMDKVASYFDVEHVHVGLAQYNSAAPGQTAVFADVWPDDAVVYRSEAPGLFATFLTFSPCTDPGTVMRWRNPDPSARSENSAFEQDADELIVNSNAGGHIDDNIT